MRGMYREALRGEHGGVTTALCTSTPGCIELGVSPVQPMDVLVVPFQAFHDHR